MAQQHGDDSVNQTPPPVSLGQDETAKDDAVMDYLRTVRVQASALIGASFVAILAFLTLDRPNVVVNLTLDKPNVLFNTVLSNLALRSFSISILMNSLVVRTASTASTEKARMYFFAMHRMPFLAIYIAGLGTATFGLMCIVTYLSFWAFSATAVLFFIAVPFASRVHKKLLDA